MNKFKIFIKIFLGIIIICIFAVGAFLINYVFMSNRRMERLETQSPVEVITRVDSDKNLHVMLVNNTDYYFAFGTPFDIYSRTWWGGWRRVFFNVEGGAAVVWLAMGFNLPPNSSAYRWHHINLPAYFGELPSGEYRIIKEFHHRDNIRDNFSVVGRFSID